MKRVLLTTGGTGGHIFPALAVAEELRRQFDNIDILFMGSSTGPEKALAEKAGLYFEGLPVSGFLGKGAKAVASMARLVLALPKAYRIIKAFAPECAAGFGGYASFAPLCIARALRVPSILHEQNAIAGVSNRLVSRFCDRICTSLPETSGFDERQVVQTGNPVRRSIIGLGMGQRTFADRNVLVVGGSQGAHALNMYMVEILPRLKEHGIEVWHQTGVQDEEMVRRAYAEQGMGHCRVSAFIDNMAQAYAWADLALCRAGASTVSELCAAGLPSVLVPYPYAIHDHQTFNAQTLVKAGAAKLFAQKDLTGDVLFGALYTLLSAPQTLDSMSKSALCLASPDAAANVVRQMQEAWTDRREQKKARGCRLLKKSGS